MDSAIAERAERAIAEKTFPGCVVGVSRGGVRKILPFGSFTYESDSQKVETGTVYDLASVTKSIPTASLALMLVEAGRLSLHDHVIRFIPQFRNDHGTTIRDLLEYRVRGPRMSQLKGRSIDEIYAHIVERGFDGPPAERAYTNLPSYVLGLIVEKAAGARLDELAREYFFRPLDMRSATYFPDARNCPPTEVQDSEVIQGIVHDESARAFAEAGRAVGHAGLFSDCGDLLSFAEPLLAGEFSAVSEGAERGLGWTVNEDWFMGTKTSGHAFGKTGFTGTSILVDRKKDSAMVILSNRTYPVRPPDATSLTSAINVFRKDIADIVLA